MTNEEAIKILKSKMDGSVDTSYEWAEAVRMAIKALKQPEQWIPCSERLPEDGTWNIFSDGKNISVERYKMDAIDHFFPQGRWFSFDKAIAWMPLPEPYAERRADDLQ